VWVEGSVLFENKKADVRVKSSKKTPVFTDVKALLQHIESHVPKKELDDTQLEEIKSILKEK
ncbi:hypothetical protein, partial [Pseudomonas sp. 2822-15]|uniref:hypothetical protein n=1 Tax=Pseudomonas sp. 2822-15 TaxID=1712677 RepID=UPI001C48B1FB